MDNAEILLIVKANLGLTTDLRDKYLTSIIQAARGELSLKGVDPEGQEEAYRLSYDQYLADYSAWAYRTRGGTETMPKYLRLKLNDLIIAHK